MTELVVLADSQGRPAGTAPKAEIHTADTPLHFAFSAYLLDAEGRLLMTRRAPEKTFAGTWENPGGAAQAGESSIQAIQRELFEETGIRAEKEDFEFLRTTRDNRCFYDHYCLRRDTPLSDIVLLPGETDDVQWATFPQIHEMIQKKQICSIIAKQFLRQEAQLLSKQIAQD